MNTFWDAIIRRSQSFEKSSLQKIKVAARREAFVRARWAPCSRDPVLWVCLERLNPSSIFIHLLTSVHLQAYSWGTFEILIKSLIFRIQRHMTWWGLHSVALLALIFESCPHWASPAQKNINHMKSKCLVRAVRSYVYLTEHICA